MNQIATPTEEYQDRLQHLSLKMYEVVFEDNGGNIYLNCDDGFRRPHSKRFFTMNEISQS